MSRPGSAPSVLCQLRAEAAGREPQVAATEQEERFVSESAQRIGTQRQQL
jgi:hypothetical protein